MPIIEVEGLGKVEIAGAKPTQEEKDAIAAAQPSTDEKWRKIRLRRDDRLQETDWWASSDLTMSDAQTAYRKALRDLPTQSDVDNITWPDKP